MKELSTSDIRFRGVPSAACMDCGQMVYMLKVKGTALYVAVDAHLNPSEAYFTVDKYGYAVTGGGFVEHGCKVDVVAQFRATWLGNQSAQLDLVFAAYSRECPKCAAPPDVECWNLVELRKNNKGVHTKNPHPERYPEA